MEFIWFLCIGEKKIFIWSMGFDKKGVEKDDKNYDDSLWVSCFNFYKFINLFFVVKFFYSNVEVVEIVKVFMFYWMIDMEYVFKR